MHGRHFVLYDKKRNHRFRLHTFKIGHESHPNSVKETGYARKSF
jgi:hypothetical protein